MRKIWMTAVAAVAFLSAANASAAPLQLAFTGTLRGAPGRDLPAETASAAVTILYDSDAAGSMGVFGTNYSLDSVEIALRDASGATIDTGVSRPSLSSFVEIFDDGVQENIAFFQILNSSIPFRAVLSLSNSVRFPFLISSPTSRFRA